MRDDRYSLVVCLALAHPTLASDSRAHPHEAGVPPLPADRIVFGKYRIEHVLLLCEVVWSSVAVSRNPKVLDWRTIAAQLPWPPVECQALWRRIVYGWEDNSPLVRVMCARDASRHRAIDADERRQVIPADVEDESDGSDTERTRLRPRRATQAR